MPESQHARFLVAECNTEPRRKKYIAVRIVTDAATGDFVCGAFVPESSGKIVYFYELAEWMNYITAANYRSHIWYCHHGGERDYKYLIPLFLDYVCDHDKASVRPIVRGDVTVIGFIIRDKKRAYDLRDSHAVLPSTLPEIVRTFAPLLEQPPLQLVQGELFNPENPEHLAHLNREVLALKQALITYDALLMEHFDVHAQWSTASTALKAWRRTIPPQKVYIRQRDEVEALSREGYFGGLTYVFDRKMHEDVVSLDINASHAAAMRQGVPIGPGSYTTRFDPARPGVYRVRVTTPPDCPMTMIGQRTDEGVRWPVGTFETVATAHEILFAMRRGYRFTILGGFRFRKLSSIFDVFLQQCETLEMLSRGTPLGLTIKHMRNALYGKFGMRPEQKDYVISEEMPEDYWFTFDPHAVPTQIVDFLYAKDIIVQKSCMMPHWAAYITAFARLAIVSVCERIGYDKILYCDTDAVFITRTTYEDALRRGVLDFGPHYGQLKVDNEWNWFQVIAPKSYHGELIDGRQITKAKGLRQEFITPEMAARAALGEDVYVPMEIVTGTMEMLKGQAVTSQVLARRWGTMESASSWEQTGENVYRPVHVSE